MERSKIFFFSLLLVLYRQLHCFLFCFIHGGTGLGTACQIPVDGFMENWNAQELVP